MREGTRRVMKLFIKRINRSQQLRFTKWVASEGQISLTISDLGSGKRSIRRNGPSLLVPESAEILEAAAILFRQFIQQGDSTSLRAMARLLDDPGISHNWKDQFTRHRAWLNHILDEPLDITFKGQPLTRRYIFDIFINGRIAHAEQAKADILEDWEVDPLLYLEAEGEFIITVAHTFHVLKYIATLCEVELAA